MQYSNQKDNSWRADVEIAVRPATVAVVAMLYGLWSGIMVITGGLMILGESYLGLSGWVIVGLGGIVFFIGMFGFLVAWGLWNQMGWARLIAVFCAIIGLLGIPIGTVMSLIMLWYLLKPETKKSFVT